MRVRRGNDLLAIQNPLDCAREGFKVEYFPSTLRKQGACGLGQAARCNLGAAEAVFWVARQCVFMSVEDRHEF